MELPHSTSPSPHTVAVGQPSFFFVVILLLRFLPEFGDPQTCIRDSVSCGFSLSPGYFTTALSQALFGASSGISPACHTCWNICIDTQLNGDPITNPVGGFAWSDSFLPNKTLLS
jgi:hypothetical protein